MRNLLIYAFVLFHAFVAHAERFPALYDVINVASDDVLNLRTEPDGTSAILGSFGPNETNIEIINLNESATWGRVNTVEGTAWVSMRFLKRQLGQEHGTTPRIKSCHGTEPFWSLRKLDTAMNGNQLDPNALFPKQSRRFGYYFEVMDQTKIHLDKWEFLRSSNHINEFALFGADGPIAIITNRSCNDGMSDKNLGWHVNIFHRTNRGETLYSGCCSLN